MSAKRSGVIGYGRRSEELRSYWIEKLSRGIEPSNLITDYKRPTKYSCGAESIEVLLPGETLTKLIELANGSSFLIYTTLLAALNICVHKYTGSHSIVVGSPARKNDDGGMSKPNAVAIVSDVLEHLPVRQFLMNIRETLIEAYSKQNYRFERIIEHLGLSGIENRGPLFDIALRLNDIHGDFPDLKNDITINFRRSGNELTGTIDYNGALFARWSIEQFNTYYVSALHQLLEKKGATVGEIELLSQADQHKLLIEWDCPRLDYPGDLHVHRLFEAQVERAPDAVALVYQDLQLTYRALNHRANQLAHFLRGLGVGHESVVGIYIERSLEMIVGLLGILKAGGAYLPLSSKHPKERLAFMLKDGQAAALLTQARLVTELPEQPAKVVCLDSEWEAIAKQSIESPVSEVSAANLAYIVYTSGSTGTPKGVMIHHEALAARVLSMEQKYGLGLSHRMLQFVSLSFDAAAEEIFPALVSGASLVLHKDPSGVPIADLLQLCQRFNVNTLHIPTAYWNRIIDELVVSDRLVPEWVKLFITGGESVSPEKLSVWRQRTKHELRSLNAYGPTESTITSTLYEMQSDPEVVSEKVRVPIGRPLENTQVCLLDARLRLIPIGMPGELCIGGVGLSRGYINRPDSTAEKFRPNSFNSAPGARLYKTGDLARYLPDGNLDLLGRIDDQVKVRGYRIELGEIESLLRQRVELQDVVVIVREDDPGENRLVAYLAPSKDNKPNISEIRNSLKESLPEYMVPSSFVVMDALPITHNGKVDRRALPIPDTYRHELERTFVAASTPVEQKLAGIWSNVLKLEQLGVNDNFFELGGHSLLAMQVISRVREAFNLEIPLHCIFEEPTVAGLAGRIEQARRTMAPAVSPPIVRASREGELPLSYAQQRLWFLDQLYPNNNLYNIPLAVRMRGNLNIRAFEQTLSEVVRRHEALRTRFVMGTGKPVQKIEKPSKMRLPVLDLSGLGEPEREEEAVRIAREEARRGFDLSIGPMLRAGLLRLGDDEHIALFTMHHIISDGWSLDVLIREVAILYETYATGGSSPLDELPIQYADYAVWQRQWLQGEVLEAKLSYWKQQLAGAPSVIQLPTDRPRPHRQSFRGANETFALPRLLMESLKALSQLEGVTLFVTLLSGFQTLLHRYTGQDDIVVGTDTANRNRVEIEGLIGFFINQLVLRADLSGDPSFRAVLGRAREVTLAAYEHQDVPFEKLVELFKPERDLTYAPLFQVKLVLQNMPRSTLELSDVTLSALTAGETKSQLDLSLFMWEVGEEILGSAIYVTDLFDQATILRFIRHFTNLLEGAVANPDQRISQLPLLTDVERRQIAEWNPPVGDYSHVVFVHQLFQAQAECRPDAVAIVFEKSHITYRGLNERANQLARYLRGLGVGPEVRVAFCLERSPEMVIALLGVLKAGGAYVPLDSNSPSERLSFMLEDAGAPILITHGKLRDQLPSHWALEIVFDRDWDEIAREETSDLNEIVPGNLAYIIYTSGSTGKPKGVGVEHGNLVNYLSGIRKKLRLESFSFAMVSTHAADLGYTALYGALCGGQYLDLIPEGISLDADALAAHFEARPVDCLKITPSHLLVLAEAGKLDSILPRRRLILGGELWSEKLISGLEKHKSDLVLFNHYGPTETTVGCCVYELPELITSREPVPIGRPLGNASVYALDTGGELAPVGGPGELYIGGYGVSRGYWERPELTAERFLPDPFDGGAGGRLYRTGDRVRWRADGNLEFLGRVDNQIKLRGYRVELGEIESVIGAFAGVRQCAVAVHRQGEGDHRLVAYIVGDLSEAELLAQARRQLPAYMAPSRIVRLEQLPLTPNGKVDRRALPAPDQAGPELKDVFHAPRTLIEEMLTGILSRLLGVKQVCVHDNFFELGGHSLLATQVISQVREVFKVEIPVGSIFSSPTAAGMAEIVDAAVKAGRGLEAPPIERVSRQGKLKLSFAQQRLWLVDRLADGNIAYNLPYAIRLTGPLNIAALQKSLNAVIARHEVFRTTFSMSDGEPLQIITPNLVVAIPVFDLSGMGEKEKEVEARRLAAEDAARPFDLSIGPLLRMCLLRLNEQEHVAIFTVHHIIFDGWSSAIFIREIVGLHERFSRGEAYYVDELPIQYADFAHWQRQWLQGDVLDTHLSYWKKQLSGMQALELPTDLPRPSVQTIRGGHQFVLLPKSLAVSLEDLSLKENVTLFMTLLTSFQILLHYYSHQDDIVIGTDVANRNRSVTEGLIGFFVNQLVLRTNLSGEPTFRELLSRVRTMALDAYAHQDLPFDKLVEVLRPERSLNMTPLFQVKIVFQNVPRTSAELSDLSITPFDVDVSAVKFDLLLNLVNSEAGLFVTLMYNTDMFYESTIKHMLARMETLLQSVVEQPDLRLKEFVELLAESEKQQRKIEQEEFREARRTALRGFKARSLKGRN